LQVTQTRHALRGRGLVCELDGRDDPIPGASREEQCSSARGERHDATRRRGQRQRPAGVVDDRRLY